MSRSLSPFRQSRVRGIESRVLDVLAREACLNAMALSSAIGEWSHADVTLALRDLRRAGAVVCDGCRRAARYRLSRQEVAA